MADDMEVEFLTPEWADALATAANDSEEFGQATDGVALTVQQEIEGATYALVFADGRLEVRWGGVDDPDVTLVQDRATAEALSRGTMNAQQAFMRGKLRLRGDLSKLTGARHALLRLDDAFASLRARTRY